MSAMDVGYGAPKEAGGRPPALKTDAHKGDAGRVLVIAGSREMPGAAILCTRAALRGGAGLVTLACIDRELMELAPGAVPEAILWDLSRKSAEQECAGEERVLEELEAGLGERSIDAIVLGPGMGNTPRTAAVLATVLANWEGALVIDADGLNALAAGASLGAGDLAGALRKRPGTAVLTPHPGEARSLLGADVGTSEEARLAAAQAIASNFAAIACLKGAGTVTTDGAQAAVNPTGNPGMATAGSGDVLAGLTAAFLTQVSPDFTPLAAARAAVFVHGHAGDLAAADLGQRSLIASDLVDRLGLAERDAPWAKGADS